MRAHARTLTVLAALAVLALPGASALLLPSGAPGLPALPPLPGVASPADGGYPTTERVLEGHTSFAAMEARGPATPPSGSGLQPRAPAIALPASPHGRFPGVLWFNDQFVVDPSPGVAGEAPRFASAAAVLVRDDGRLPCGGALLVVNRGDADPRVSLATDAASAADAALSYKVSHLVTDPNDRAWIEDEYVTPQGEPLWVVNLGGNPAFTPDDGALSCAGASSPASAATCGLAPVGTTATDTPCMGYLEPSANGYCYEGNAFQPGSSCQDATRDPARAYNALFYASADELTMFSGVSDHSPGSFDTNGCQAGTEWACPGNDDNAEANSHAFNPRWMQGTSTPQATTDPVTTGACPVNGAELANHGGSFAALESLPDTCDDLHATYDVDLYYSGTWRPPVPAARVFAEQDTEGSAAPFLGLGTAPVS